MRKPSKYWRDDAGRMNDDDPFRWICLRSHASRQPINEAALVLTAMGIDNYVELEAGEWCLFIRQGHRPAAVDQLERYRAENVPPRVRIPRIITFDSGWAGIFGYLLVIWSVPALAWWGMLGADWQNAGLLQAGLVSQGEWWRAVTALTLHSSFAHLVANSLFGAVFGLMAGRYLGSGFAWLLILLGGVFGNLFNAWARPDEFRSLGASTATFAAVGLIAAFVWRRGYFRGRGLRRGLAPVFAGIALLVFTGLGGANTDIFAHVAGFACGAGLGYLAAGFDIRRLGHSGQYLSGAAAVLLVFIAWSMADAT